MKKICVTVLLYRHFISYCETLFIAQYLHLTLIQFWLTNCKEKRRKLCSGVHIFAVIMGISILFFSKFRFLSEFNSWFPNQHSCCSAHATSLTGTAAKEWTTKTHRVFMLSLNDRDGTCVNVYQQKRAKKHDVRMGQHVGFHVRVK